MGAQSAEHVAFSRFAGAQEWNLLRVQMRALERNFGVVYIYDYAVTWKFLEASRRARRKLQTRNTNKKYTETTEIPISVR